MNFVYTEPALQAKKDFQEQQVKLLEGIIAEKKFVFGDETIEVTASDILEASHYIRPYPLRKRQRYYLVRLVSQLYFVLGFLITVGAIFYPQFQSIIKNNPPQAMGLLTGVAMMFLGFFFTYFYRFRIKKEEEERIRYENAKSRINS